MLHKTNRALARALRQPGKVLMPVYSPDDIQFFPIEKAAVIAYLDKFPERPAFWSYTRVDDPGRHVLDVADNDWVNTTEKT